VGVQGAVPPSCLRLEVAASRPARQAGGERDAARAAGLYDEALALAGSAPCDPKTLVRAARDLADERSEFAMAAGLLALRWLVQGYGYEVTGADVLAAYHIAMKAAERIGKRPEVRGQVWQLVSAEDPDGFVASVLGQELGL
jgi:hypothetical protein